jgi:hypothetical protein
MTSRTHPPESSEEVGELVGVGFFVGFGFGLSCVVVGSGADVEVGAGAAVEREVEVAVEDGAGAGALLVGTFVGVAVACSTTAVAVGWVPVVPAVVLEAAVVLEEVASPQPSADGVLAQSPPGRPGNADDIASSLQLSPDQNATAPVVPMAKAASAAAMRSFRRGLGAFVEVRVSVDMATKGRGTRREAPVRPVPTTVGGMPAETWITSRCAR